MKTRTVLYFSDLAILGGGEVCMAAMIEQLDRSRFRPVVVAPEEGPLVEAMRSRGVTAHLVKLHQGMRFWRVRRFSPLLRMRRAENLARLARLLDSEQVALVHTHGGMYPENIRFLGRLARRAGLPVVWECGYGATYRREVMDELIAPWVDRVIAVSGSVRDRLLEAGWPDGGAIEVLHHGLDVQAWRPDVAGRAAVRRSLGADDGDVLFGMVGRVVAIKGHETFLEAARRMIPRGVRARFVVVGDQRPVEGTRGRYYRALCEQAAGAEFASCMVMAGWRDDVREVMNALDVLVQPSSQEAFGRTLLEAMALGKPVVATRAGGMPEIVIDGETGCLVPVGDAGALAGKMETLALDAGLRRRMGEAGRQRALSRFDLASRTRRVEAMYQELLAARGRGAASVPDGLQAAGGMR